MGFGRKMKSGAESIGMVTHKEPFSFLLKKNGGHALPAARIASPAPDFRPARRGAKRIYQTNPTDIPAPKPDEK